MYWACEPGKRLRVGPIALVEPGDIISIDIAACSLELVVPESELSRRLANWKRPKAKITHGYLGRYASLVTSADTGAVLKQPELD